jgi:hypothetical protein
MLIPNALLNWALVPVASSLKPAEDPAMVVNVPLVEQQGIFFTMLWPVTSKNELSADMAM